jgi:hypothetical protein
MRCKITISLCFYIYSQLVDLQIPVDTAGTELRFPIPDLVSANIKGYHNVYYFILLLHKPLACSLLFIPIAKYALRITQDLEPHQHSTRLVPSNMAMEHPQPLVIGVES